MGERPIPTSNEASFGSGSSCQFLSSLPQTSSRMKMVNIQISLNMVNYIHIYIYTYVYIYIYIYCVYIYICTRILYIYIHVYCINFNHHHILFGTSSCEAAAVRLNSGFSRWALPLACLKSTLMPRRKSGQSTGYPLVN